MDDKRLAERLFRGRAAEDRLKDEFLSECFEQVIINSFKDIIRAKTEQETLKAKSHIDAVLDVKKQIKVWMDDGVIAQRDMENE